MPPRPHGQRSRSCRAPRPELEPGSSGSAPRAPARSRGGRRGPSSPSHASAARCSPVAAGGQSPAAGAPRAAPEPRSRCGASAGGRCGERGGERGAGAGSPGSAGAESWARALPQVAAAIALRGPGLSRAAGSHGADGAQAAATAWPKPLSPSSRGHRQQPRHGRGPEARLDISGELPSRERVLRVPPAHWALTLAAFELLQGENCVGERRGCGLLSTARSKKAKGSPSSGSARAFDGLQSRAGWKAPLQGQLRGKQPGDAAMHHFVPLPKALREPQNSGKSHKDLLSTLSRTHFLPAFPWADAGRMPQHHQTCSLTALCSRMGRESF